ncbi:hypothetical protein ASG43_20955 [Aureimonas sp. Leaf454]|nr:hypothetical protein ASG43_20955 [Aureimonas sp. Leaf454]
MVSINSTANSAVLANLRQINNDIATSQMRIGTGKRVNSAADDASAWKMAQTIRSDMKAQSNLATGIARSKGRADAAIKAIDSIVTLVGKIKEVADGVTTSNADAAGITVATNKVTALEAQIASVLSGAGFDGDNWLNTATATKTTTIGINSGAPATVAVSTIDISLAASYTAVTGAATTTVAEFGTLSGLITTLVDTLSGYQGTLSTFSESLGIQQDFQTAMKSVRETALSNLVDADLTEENAKISALQTQQALAYQALSIGNAASQNILRLFQ